MVGRVGDVNPIDYSGGFIYIDETGVYPPEVEYIDAPNEYSGEPWKIYRFILEPCTYTNGVLSDNKYHPDKPAWFAAKIESVAAYEGASDEDGIIQALTGTDVSEKALAWMAIGEYFGFENLDSYPLVFTDESELRKRYAEEMSGQPTTKGNK